MKYILIILFLMTTELINAQDPMYAVAKEPTPVLNTPDFQMVFGGGDGVTVKTDGQGLIREMEFIALPGTVFTLLGEYDYDDHKIFKVETDEYQYNSQLFVDSRFVTTSIDKPVSPVKKLPSKEEIYKFLDNAVGSKYCWGGNYVPGVKKLAQYYQPKANIDGDVEYKWTLQGCDCSGLMYEATNGYTPRNTSKLVDYGEAVEIAGLSAEEIAAKMKPFDMMVWNGHVIYCYDATTAIQSSLSKGGVVKTDLVETLQGLMKKRKAVNNYSDSSKERFVVRHWYNE